MREVAVEGHGVFMVFQGFSLSKVKLVAPLVRPTLNVLDATYRPKLRPTVWPIFVRAMTAREIREGKRHGKGHGLYIPARHPLDAIVAIDAKMPARAIYLNLIHELAHHVDPRFTEKEINDKIVPYVFQAVSGIALDKASWRKYRGTNPNA